MNESSVVQPSDIGRFLKGLDLRLTREDELFLENGGFAIFQKKADDCDPVPKWLQVYVQGTVNEKIAIDGKEDVDEIEIRFSIWDSLLEEKLSDLEEKSIEDEIRRDFEGTVWEYLLSFVDVVKNSEDCGNCLEVCEYFLQAYARLSSRSQLYVRLFLTKEMGKFDIDRFIPENIQHCFPSVSTEVIKIFNKMVSFDDEEGKDFLHEVSVEEEVQKILKLIGVLFLRNSREVIKHCFNSCIRSRVEAVIISRLLVEFGSINSYEFKEVLVDKISNQNLLDSHQSVFNLLSTLSLLPPKDFVSFVNDSGIFFLQQINNSNVVFFALRLIGSCPDVSVINYQILSQICYLFSISSRLQYFIVESLKYVIQQHRNTVRLFSFSGLMLSIPSWLATYITGQPKYCKNFTDYLYFACFSEDSCTIFLQKINILIASKFLDNYSVTERLSFCADLIRDSTTYGLSEDNQIIMKRILPNIIRVLFRGRCLSIAVEKVRSESKFLQECNLLWKEDMSDDLMYFLLSAHIITESLKSTMMQPSFLQSNECWKVNSVFQWVEYISSIRSTNCHISVLYFVLSCILPVIHLDIVSDLLPSIPSLSITLIQLVNRILEEPNSEHNSAIISKYIPSTIGHIHED